jgi:drug/metabolite transporter (DMT)-like permease
MNDAKTNQTAISPKAGWQSDAALIALALMWGTSHVITKEILATHSPAFYTSMRFGVAAVCFALAFAGHLRRSNGREIKQGVLLGLLSFAGIGLYVVGLAFTQVSKAGFITGLYLVFTPLLSYALFRTRPTRDHVTGLIIAIAGFTLLSFPHGGRGVNWGDMLVLMAAVAWAAHIVATSEFASDGDVRRLAALQVITVAVLATIAYFILRAMGMETSPNPMDGQFLLQIGYMAVMVTFIAALVQTWAQGRVNPTHAVLFYALEPATAAVYAYFVFGEKLSLWGGVGAALIVTGVMVSRLRLTSRLTGHERINTLPIEADC